MGTQQSNWWMKKGKRASLSWRERRHAEEAETAACLEGIRLAAGWHIELMNIPVKSHSA